MDSSIKTIIIGKLNQLVERESFAKLQGFKRMKPKAKGEFAADSRALRRDVIGLLTMHDMRLGPLALDMHSASSAAGVLKNLLGHADYPADLVVMTSDGEIIAPAKQKRYMRQQAASQGVPVASLVKAATMVSTTAVPTV